MRVWVLAVATSLLFAVGSQGQTIGTPTTALVPRGGGTVVVAIALSDGLVVAADSRLTILFKPGTNPNYKIGSDSEEKVFDVGQVAIATYGAAFLSGRSIGSIIVDFSRNRTAKTSDVEAIAKEIASYMLPIFRSDQDQTKTAQPLGFLIAGYSKDGIGEIYQVEFPTSPDAMLLPQSTRSNQGIVWRGETDVIQRLVKGMDPGMVSLPVWTKVDDATKKEIAAELSGQEYYVPYNFLMLQDGIDLALALVQITADMQRFSFGTLSAPGAIPGIGGAVDVLVIDPFKLSWIKHSALTAKDLAD